MNITARRPDSNNTDSKGKKVFVIPSYVNINPEAGIRDHNIAVKNEAIVTVDSGNGTIPYGRPVVMMRDKMILSIQQLVASALSPENIKSNEENVNKLARELEESLYYHDMLPSCGLSVDSYYLNQYELLQRLFQVAVRKLFNERYGNERTQQHETNIVRPNHDVHCELISSADDSSENMLHLSKSSSAAVITNQSFPRSNIQSNVGSTASTGSSAKALPLFPATTANMTTLPSAAEISDLIEETLRKTLGDNYKDKSYPMNLAFGNVTTTASADSMDYSVERGTTSDVVAAGSTKRQKKFTSRFFAQIPTRERQHKLLLLYHSANCTNHDHYNMNRNTQQSKSYGIIITPDKCNETKVLWKHMTNCKDSNCKYKDCVVSRYLLNRYRRCKPPNFCSVCRPIREFIRKTEEQEQLSHNSQDLMNDSDIPLQSHELQGNGDYLPLVTSIAANVISSPSVSVPSHMQCGYESVCKLLPQLDPNLDPTSLLSEIDDIMVLGPPAMDGVDESTPDMNGQMDTDLRESSHSNKYDMINDSTIIIQEPTSSATIRENNPKFANNCLPSSSSCWRLNFLNILNDFINDPKGGFLFDVPVDPIKLGLIDYYDIVKNPMDLGTVRQNIDLYETVEQAISDVLLTFDNAILYNQNGCNEILEIATNFKENFQNKVQVLLQETI